MVIIQVVGDKHGVVFSGLMNAPLQPTPKKEVPSKALCMFTN